MRQNVSRRARNRRRKKGIKDAARAFDEAVRAGDKEKAAEQLKLCYKNLDHVAAKGTIHKNAAARSKARLAKRMSEAFG
jgi:small subunit ribosomal protein S20